MVRTLLTAFISFTSTNIDDIFVLMLFFSQINSVMKRRHIVLGQYLGIGFLTTISIIGAFGLSLIPGKYVGLLGLVPIYLGIKAYIHHKKVDKGNGTADQQELQSNENTKLEETDDVQKNRILTLIKSFVNPSVVKVASVTIANGGDNIGVYVPLFTSMSLFDILITVIIFLFLTALLCVISLRFAEHPFVRRTIEKNKHIFVPIIFIGLGIFILMKSGTIIFLYKKFILSLSLSN